MGLQATERAEAVAVGAVVGALLRAAQVGLAHGSPLATLLVNLIGALVLGAVLALAPGRAWLRPALGVGLCGAYTTFSALSGDVLTVAAAEGAARGLGLALASGLLGPLAALAGLRLARRWPALGVASLGLPLVALAVTALRSPIAAPHAVDGASVLVVAAGGAAGALWRDAAGAFALSRGFREYPLSTLVVNLAGCLAWGLIAPRVTGLPALLLVTGLLGGFTTFSTFAVDVVRLVEEGRPGAALACGAASLAGGVALAALGG